MKIGSSWQLAFLQTLLSSPLSRDSHERKQCFHSHGGWTKRSCGMEIVTTVAIPAAMCLNPHRALPLHRVCPAWERQAAESVGNRSCCRFSARHLSPGQCFLVRCKTVKEQMRFQVGAGSGELRPDPCEAAVGEDTPTLRLRAISLNPQSRPTVCSPSGTAVPSLRAVLLAHWRGPQCKERRWLCC